MIIVVTRIRVFVSTETSDCSGVGGREQPELLGLEALTLNPATMQLERLL